MENRHRDVETGWKHNPAAADDVEISPSVLDVEGE
jgi:hypothetical protein